MKRSSQEINRQAADWAARIAAGPLAPEQQAAFELWLAADTRHLGACGRMLATLERLDRVRGIGADAIRPLIAAKSPFWNRRRLMLGGGGTAGLAAAGIAGIVLWPERAPPPAITRPQTEFTTRIGETRILTLADNSVVTLNTDSRLQIAFSPELRKLRLLRGEALFHVAKNKKRPFVVIADDTQIRAVGTSFTVRLSQSRPLQIVVQEGVVEVTRPSVPAATPVRAVADTQTVVAKKEPITVLPIPYTKVARTLAWQYGQIAFDNETLREAAEEFARYSNTKVVVDTAVAGQTITGLFAANDPMGFARAAAAALNLRTEVGVDEVRIYR
jgi:transmembrane sensor